MSRREVLAWVFATHVLVAGSALSGEASVGSDATAQWMVQQEKGWAEQSCGKGWVVGDLLAPDFHGTSPKGARYDKPSKAPDSDPSKTWHTDCRLLSTDVRFFGPDVAVVYGSESSVVPLPDSKDERRCLVWTDTWLKRNGKWQIIAAQDMRVDCSSM
jgi:hypothetical protein